MLEEQELSLRATYRFDSDEEFEAYINGRPNSHISNWPVPPVNPDGSYVNSWHAFFPYGLVLFVLLINVTIVIYVIRGMWINRRNFPITLQPLHLNIFHAMCCTLTFFGYVAHILVPSMPCWAHIIVTNFPYFPHAGIGYTTSLRLVILYNAQSDMAAGKKDSKFLRLREFCRRGYKFDAIVIVLSGIFFSATLLSRIAGLSDYAYLQLPVRDVRCGSLSTLQFAFRLLNSLIALRAQRISTNIIKKVKEPYPFRPLYNRVTKINATLIFANDLPLWLKQFWIGVTFETFSIVSWICVVLWATAFAHSYLISVLVTVVRHAGERGRIYFSSNKSKNDSSTRHTQKAQVSSFSGKTRTARILSPAQLKENLLDDTHMQEQFKSYLVREFCVENMLFIIALSEFKKSIGTPEAVSIAKDIDFQFVRANATFEVNVSAALRQKTHFKVETACGESTDGRLPKECIEMFTPMEEEVFKMMMDPFNRFLRRQESESSIHDPSSTKHGESKGAIGSCKTVPLTTGGAGAETPPAPSSGLIVVKLGASSNMHAQDAKSQNALTVSGQDAKTLSLSSHASSASSSTGWRSGIVVAPVRTPARSSR